MRQYDTILNSKDLPKALCEHFSYLTQKGSEALLSAIMKKATGVRVNDGNLVVSFTDHEELHASPPGDVMKYDRWPQSFQEYVAIHEYLSFGTEHWELCLGNRKSFIYKCTLLNKYDKNDILVPVINTFFYQMWLYHPMEKNSSGENRIYHFAPNAGEDLDSPSELSAGQIFLKQMASSLDIFLDQYQ